MKKTHIVLMTLLVAGLATPPAALAQAPLHKPPYRHLQQRIQQAPDKLEQAERATGQERRRIMDKHMGMLEESLKMMEDMKPAEKMTMEEHQDWINGHRTMMKQMLKQMRREHRMMMDMSE